MADKKTDERIQEMQVVEQNLQNVFMQKHAFEMELNESLEALSEIESSTGEVFKIVGQLMLKFDRAKIQDDLSNKKKLLELRIKNLEKQEKSLSERLESLREELIDEEKD